MSCAENFPAVKEVEHCHIMQNIEEGLSSLSASSFNIIMQERPAGRQT